MQITWGVKQAGIDISDPTQTAPDNFETEEYSYKVLADSLINKESLDLWAHSTQVS